MAGRETLVPQVDSKIPTASEGLYRRTCNVLAERGYTRFARSNSTSINQPFENKATKGPLDFVAKVIHGTAPSQIEVAINPDKVGTRRRGDLPTGDIVREMLEAEIALKSELPEEVGSVISMGILHTSRIKLTDLSGKEIYISRWWLDALGPDGVFTSFVVVLPRKLVA